MDFRGSTGFCLTGSPCSYLHCLESRNPGVWDSWIPILSWPYHKSLVALFWGLNVYPVHADEKLSAVNPYTTYRYKRAGVKLPVIVAEFAEGDGAQTPDFVDIATWWRKTQNDFVAATAWYVSGHGVLGQWNAANLPGKLYQLSQAYVRRQ